MTEHYTVDWKSCETHCWCALNEADYPESSVMYLFTKTMKETPHDHGDTTTCTGCMVEDGRMRFGVDPARGSQVTEVILNDAVPPPWKEGDPAPPDATHLFDGLSQDG